MKQEPPPQSALDRTITSALDRRQHASTLRKLSLPSPDAVDFSSNDFLSLSHSPLLKARFLTELQSASLPLGSGGSRLLDGNTSYAISLEQSIAEFHNAPTCLLANSGFDANTAIFCTLPQPTDIILYDSLIHASVHDGMRSSRVPSTQRFSFSHNSLISFHSTLSTIIATFPGILSGHSSIFIALEAIYSMDGDVAPLPSIIRTIDTLIPRHILPNIHLVLDEAHSTGVLGPQGRGLVSSLGLEHRVSIRLHTFGKSLSANGAAILCSENVKRYLLNYARPLIYTTFLSSPSLALVKAAYSLMQDRSTEPLVADLQRNMRVLQHGLAQLHHRLATQRATDLLRVTMHEPQSPIFSVQTCDPRGLAKWCQERGYVVRPIVPPTVPKGSERVRVCLHAGNGTGEIRALVSCVGAWCAEQVARRKERGAAPGDGRGSGRAGSEGAGAGAGEERAKL
ncbi:5-aminolevulinic acid synthase [Sphaceloma murrayae]|uniref:5-aminolevulinic acid synthase n=1 Tax=Sphaceloma murrayae TaxID=2082308 RepID=A0A2K1R233_9PEZI|nr:5-aminolevulinic acid synthase [Sphaceloma murrayae]